MAADDGSGPTCKVVRAGEVFQGRQALAYAPGISAETVGARGINVQLVVIPPQGRAKAHLHAQHETAAYVIDGEIELDYGDRLQHHALIRTGEFLSIPPGVPHVPFNTSQKEAV